MAQDIDELHDLAPWLAEIDAGRIHDGPAASIAREILAR
jgi:hypothetical protein